MIPVFYDGDYKCVYNVHAYSPTLDVDMRTQALVR